MSSENNIPKKMKTLLSLGSQSRKGIGKKKKLQQNDTNNINVEVYSFSPIKSATLFKNQTSPH